MAGRFIQTLRATGAAGMHARQTMTINASLNSGCCSKKTMLEAAKTALGATPVQEVAGVPGAVEPEDVAELVREGHLEKAWTLKSF